MWQIEGTAQWELALRGQVTVSLPLVPSKSGEDNRRYNEALARLNPKQDDTQPKPTYLKPDPRSQFNLNCIGAGPKPTPTFSLSASGLAEFPLLPPRPAVNFFREETKEFLKARPVTPVMHAPDQAAAVRAKERAERVEAGIEFMRQRMVDQFQTMSPGDALATEQAIPIFVNNIVHELDRDWQIERYDDYRREVLNPLLWERWDREFERFALLEQLATTGPGPGESSGRAASRRGTRRRSKPIHQNWKSEWYYDGNKKDSLAKAIEAARESLKPEPAKEPEPTTPNVTPPLTGNKYDPDVVFAGPTPLKAPKPGTNEQWQTPEALPRTPKESVAMKSARQKAGNWDGQGTEEIRTILTPEQVSREPYREPESSKSAYRKIEYVYREGGKKITVHLMKHDATGKIGHVKIVFNNVDLDPAVAVTRPPGYTPTRSEE